MTRYVAHHVDTLAGYKPFQGTDLVFLPAEQAADSNAVVNALCMAGKFSVEAYAAVLGLLADLPIMPAANELLVIELCAVH